MIPSTNTNDTALAAKPSRGGAVTVWSVTLIIVVLSLVAHLVSNSTMHLSAEMWQQKVALHLTNNVFSLRPLTTTIVTILHDHVGLAYLTGFMILQFTLYLLCGPAFWLFLKELGFKRAHALAGMIMYLLTMPLFMAHFEPVHTWSDFWVYLLVPLSLAMAIRRQYAAAVASLFLAFMARETTVLFLPVWFLFVYVDRGRKFTLAAVLTLLSAGLFVGIRLWLFGRITAGPENGPGFNFESFLRTSDTVFSLIVSLGFVWIVGLWQAFHRSGRLVPFYDVIRFGAFLTTVGFVLSTLLLAHARETRLFAPPAILLLPLVLVYLQERANRIRALLSHLPTWGNIVAGVALLALSIWIAKLAFPKFEYRLWRDGNWTYLGLHIAFTIVFLLIEFSGKKRPVQA